MGEPKCKLVGEKTTLTVIGFMIEILHDTRPPFFIGVQFLKSLKSRTKKKFKIHFQRSFTVEIFLKISLFVTSSLNSLSIRALFSHYCYVSFYLYESRTYTHNLQRSSVSVTFHAGAAKMSLFSTSMSGFVYKPL